MPEPQVPCPNCQAACPVEAGDPDRPARCPACGATFVPGTASAPPPPAGTTEDIPRATAPGSPLAWQVGEVVLGLYEVKQVHEGGMGLVYRVRHRGWDLDLAVKCPRVDFFREERDKENFERE